MPARLFINFIIINMKSISFVHIDLFRFLSIELCNVTNKLDPSVVYALA